MVRKYDSNHKILSLLQTQIDAQNRHAHPHYPETFAQLDRKIRLREIHFFRAQRQWHRRYDARR